MTRRPVQVATIAAVTALVVALVRLLRGRPAPAFESAPPLDPVRQPPPQPPDASADADRPWVEPGDDGACPATHPVKAKLSSGIYHVPSGVSYHRTRPDRCYRSAAHAGADGLRPAKR